MIEKYSIRTDLALEQKERFESDHVEIQGVVLEEDYDEEREIRITRVRIETENGAKAMGKPVGTYITMEAPEMAVPDEAYHREISVELAKFLAGFLKCDKEDLSVLVVGLGNRKVTPDALGPLVVDNLNRYNAHNTFTQLLEMGDEQLPRHRDRLIRGDRPIGRDLEGQAIEIRIVQDAGRIDVEGDFLDRRVIRIGGDDANGVDVALDLVLVAGDVSPAVADEDGHDQVGAFVYGRDLKLGVADGAKRGQFEVAGFEDGRALDVDFDPLEVGRVVVDLQDEVLEVEDDARHVGADAREGGELMGRAFDLDGDYRSAGEGAKQDAAEGVADGDAESPFKRLDDELGVVVGAVFVGLDTNRFEGMRELKLRGVRKLTVCYSRELPIKTGGRTPASISYVPGTAGLMIAGHVIRQIAGI